MEVKCEFCGVIFRRQKSLVERSKFNYCSKECSGKAKRKRTENKCEVCWTPSLNSRFCSVNCHNTHQSRNKNEYTCKICGKLFYWSPSREKEYSPTYCSIKCRSECPDWYRNAVVAANVKQQNSKERNKLEKAGAELLYNAGIEFEEQVLIANKFIVDAKIKDLDIIIQWDGDYWHGYRKEGDETPLTDRQKKRVSLDKSQDAYMRKCGFVVLRFWEHEVYNQPEKVSEIIKNTIQQPAA